MSEQAVTAARVRASCPEKSGGYKSRRKTGKEISRNRYVQSASFAAAFGIFSACDGPLSTLAIELLCKKEFSKLLHLSVDPRGYTDVNTFRDDWLIVESMSKFPDWDIGIDREQVALLKFAECERACLATNLRLSRYVPEITNSATAEKLFEATRRKISSCLGPFDWDVASQYFGFGPGASTRLSRSKGDAYYKYGELSPDVSGNCALLAGCAIAQSPGWYKHLAGIDPEASFCVPSPALIARDLLNIVKGNRVTTVPKNAKTDRVIAIEPDLNMYIQKGIGACIRQRLKRVGVDLDDQTCNQRMASIGSEDGSLCTVDLSSASDSVSTELVEQLLPPDWATALKACRSPYGVLPSGEIVYYQKVSSMGNGFTFELESLIFWALCSSVVDSYQGSGRRVYVYGDDLIFPTACYGFVTELLAWSGFTVNDKKSFYTGPFRESCGKHYFLGHDVTPFYIRKDVNTVERLLVLANQIRRYASNRYPWGLDGRFEFFYSAVVGWLPEKLRKPSISEQYGDVALFGDFDECRPSRAPHFLEGWLGVGWVPRTSVKKPKAFGGGLMLKALGNLARRMPPKRGDTPFNMRQEALMGVESFNTQKSDSARKKTILVPQWISRGPWIH